MRIISRMTLAEKITAARKTFALLTSDIEIQAALDRFGYSAARIAEGSAPLDQLIATTDRQQVEYSEKYDSTRELQRVRAEADATYDRLRRTAQVALADDAALQGELGLGGRRRDASSALAGWLLQAGGFYRRALANPQVLGKLAALQVEPAQFEAGL